MFIINHHISVGNLNLCYALLWFFCMTKMGTCQTKDNVQLMPSSDDRQMKNDLHLPHAALTMYQRGVMYSGIKVFNALPVTLKDISGNPKQFEVALKKYLPSHSFYSLYEFFNEPNA